MLSADLVPQADITSSNDDVNTSATVLFQEPQPCENITIDVSLWETQTIADGLPDDATNISNNGTPTTDDRPSTLDTQSSVLDTQHSTLVALDRSLGETITSLGATSLDDSGNVVAQLTETLRVANAPPMSPEMRLVDNDLSHFNGQIFFLDFDGASGVTYDGPVRVENVEVYPFELPAGFSANKFDFIGSVLISLDERFAALGVTFTTNSDNSPYPNLPPQGGKELKSAKAEGLAYSTIFIGGDDSAFSKYGSFLGLAEKVDVGNRDRSDNAFVFSDKIFQPGMSAVDYAAALADVIGHEAAHLLGYAHADGPTAGLSTVAAGAPDLPEGATITVNSAADSSNTHVADGFITLREAIFISNQELAISSLSNEERKLVIGTPNAVTRDKIVFNIGEGGAQTIFVGTGGLPFIIEPVVIDATYPGFDVTTTGPIIKIDASGAGAIASGLVFLAGSSVVKGLVLSDAHENGIVLFGDNNTIVGNRIGSFNVVDSTGVANVMGNQGRGILIFDSANNQVGGGTEAERNIISGNRFTGVEISGAGATGNVVQGNWIGTDVTGNGASGNGSHGVLITGSSNTGDATDNLIGGSLLGEGNVISGNLKNGVDVVRGARNRIQGNLIGTSQDGLSALGNHDNGVQIVDAPDTLIGGEELEDQNIISANGLDGIQIVGSGAKHTIVQNNLIGTDINGELDLGNGDDGIFLGEFIQDLSLNAITPAVVGAPSDTTIGGNSVNARNIISGNGRDGVHIEAGTTKTFVQGNIIGLVQTGSAPLGNTGDGVAIIDSFGNTIGGVVDESVVDSDGLAAMLPRNVISANGGAGVRISGAASADNHVLGNYIGTHRNGETATNDIGEKIFGNKGDGVAIEDAGAIEISSVTTMPGNVIGDIAAGGRNVISGNLSFGVSITGASKKNSVLGNYIGTDRLGNSEIPNGRSGVILRGKEDLSRVPSGNVIGGDSGAARNVISGNNEGGVQIAFGALQTKLWGNFIGTKANGVEPLANAGPGVLILDASDNDIGGLASVPGAPLGNVISGNRGEGVEIISEKPGDFFSDSNFSISVPSTQNRVRGNIIGLDAFGITAMLNWGSGVAIVAGSNNTIGGTTPFERNIISGNLTSGVYMNGGDGNKVLGNFIGTDISGTLSRGNGVDGVRVFSVFREDVIIGGTAAGAGNVISGNKGNGITIDAFIRSRILIQGNYIGTDLTGNRALPNFLDGVLIQSGFDNTIGGLTENAGNVISGNLGNGVRITSDPDPQLVNIRARGNLVEGNFIGVGSDGVTNVGNLLHGVLIENSIDNVIGGEESGAGNTIAFNGRLLFQHGHGVVVASGTGNLISRNSIYDNAGRGIDLGNDSFTLNDIGDEDLGANNLQDYPVVVGVQFLPGLKVITWNLNSTPSLNDGAPSSTSRIERFTIEFFANDTPDRSGFGEGKRFLKSINVSTDGDGFAEFTEEFAITDNFISATATDLDNNTSEFSMVDTDGDALADAWEDASIAGFIDINEDLISDLILAGAVNSQGLSVSPNRKDLFVEVDAMKGRVPDSVVLPGVEKAFAEAPAELVNNPFGSPGIALHAILDEKNLLRFPFTFTDSTPGVWPEFDLIKRDHFGTVAEQGNQFALAAKALVYRYALFADTYGFTASGGISELAQTRVSLSTIRGFGGSDFMVTLGLWDRPSAVDGAGNPSGFKGGTAKEQAGTFMHELGHTLGLFHAGDEPDFENYKPNYHGVMNYLWTTPLDWMFEDMNHDSHQDFNDINGNGVKDPDEPFVEFDRNGDGWKASDDTWELIYSTRAFNDLFELSLDETAGIGGDKGHWVAIGPKQADGSYRIVSEFGPVDWNLDGSISPIPAAADLNSFVEETGLGQILHGSEDWSHLRFYFRELPNFRDGNHGTQFTLSDDMTLETKELLNSVGDGPGVFQLSQTNSFNVDEAGGFATVIVTRAAGTVGTVSVHFSTSDGSALANSDYTATSGTLTFGVGEYIKSFTIPILNDLLFEPTKTLHVTLSHPTGGATLGQRIAADLSILDDDGPGNFQFSSASYLVNETDHSATITVTRTGGTVGAVSVKFATSNASATSGQDYTATSGTLNFANGESSKTFVVTILDDSIVEGIEALNLVLSNPTGGASLGTFSQGILIIKDVEAGILQFGDPVYQIGESGSTAKITVTRTNGSDGTVTVNYATSNGSATASSDYTTTSGSLTFGDGETVKSFTVPIINDALAEATETINITLSNPTAGAVLGTAKTAELRILDDEVPAFQFNALSTDVNETAGTATIQVTRKGDISVTASVDFTTADGTASAVTDYLASSGTIRFAAGETSKTFNVTVVDDKLGEGIKTVQLILRNPSVGASVGTPGTATLRIIDDETVNAATFVVTNINNSGAGSLRQAILDANARAGTDFITFNIAGAGVHTIRPLSVLPTITSPVTIDGYSEPGTSPNTLAVGDNAVLLIELVGSGMASSDFNYGIRITAGNSIVRGLVINRFSGSSGVLIDANGGNLITGNFIGTDPTGFIGGTGGGPTALFNLYGIKMGAAANNILGSSSNNVIGGTTPEARNVISGNGTGIAIDSDPRSLQSRGNLILGNYVGVAANGVSPLGNGTGISIGTGDFGANGLGNTIGGIEPGAGNIIAFNSSGGVSILSGYGNLIRGNSIYSNDPAPPQNVNNFRGLGIRLVDNGEVSPVSSIDANDADTGDRLVRFSGGQTLLFPGGNRVQNFPVLSSAIIANGTITIQGRLDSARKTIFQIDFYSNDAVDGTSYGEGKYYIGAASVKANALGHAEFEITFAASLVHGQFITATATDPGNNTSEFSARVKVGQVLGSVFVVNTTGDHDDGVADAQDTTLREAILAANNHPGKDTIKFNIPGSGVRTITLVNALPPIMDAVTIDGYTQPGARPNSLAVGFDGVLLIQITLSPTVNSIPAGLIVSGGNSTVRGLIINRFSSSLFVVGAGNNVIEGNIVGLDATGNSNVSFNGSSFGGAIFVRHSSNNLIGGSLPEARNLLTVVELNFGANSNRVQGNYIGTRANGLSKLLGSGVGNIFIDGSSSNLIGGTAAGERNVLYGTISISGAPFIEGATDFSGFTTSVNNRVLGDFIGIGADGLTPLGYTGAGVSLSGDAKGNSIGGIQPGAGNIISWNGAGGVSVNSAFNSLTNLPIHPESNAIRGNSIYLNGGLGIDLEGDIYSSITSVTRNDNGDLAVGPNHLQNFPVLSSALSANGSITIQGRLNSTPNRTFQIDFYANEQMDPSGYGEGQTYIGTIAETTDATGRANFAVTLPVAIPNGRFITATATNPTNDTSEFSARVKVGQVLGSVLVVNTTDDHDDGVADASDTTLREAIHAANNHPGHDTIVFNIPGQGVKSIFMIGSLPPITDEVTIDGYTQPGSHPNTLPDGDDAVLLIELKGNPQQNPAGLDIRAGNTTIRGLVINGFNGGIFIAENGGNVIEGNFLGTDASGTLAVGATVRIFASSNNLIGGTTPAARNIIAGSSTAIQISGGSGPAIIPNPVAFYVATGNLVQGNFIGTDRTGTVALNSAGVFISGSSNNIIGGTTVGARNIIVGVVSLGGNGVTGALANNLLEGNYIGTDVTGRVGLGNGSVSLTGVGNVVGGATPGAGNVISNGIAISFDGGNHIVQGNRIGTDKDGMFALGNKGNGIIIQSSGNLIGGVQPGAGNIISGNGGNGILLTGVFPTLPPAINRPATGNLIQGNFIGTQADGVSPLPNLADGIVVTPDFGNSTAPGAVNNSIGGIESAARNVIAFNGGNGINLNGGTATAGTGIAILSNSIFSNGKLGIDLKGNGPTPNDTGDGDAGDNNLQNFPVLTTVTNAGSSITITGTLNSRPSNTYRLEFFDNIAFDSSNFGEGARFIGATSVTTNTSGNASFTVTFQVAVPLTHIITSTATDSQGNTSEFSGRQPNASTGETANLAVTKSDAPDPILAGQLLTYTIAVTNNGPDAATNVVVVDTLPTGVIFQSATPGFGVVGGAVVGSIGTIASGSTATVHITIAPTTTGVRTNSVTVAGDQYDPVISNNSASASTTVNPAADLSVTKTNGATGPLSEGNFVAFTITVTNRGPSQASGVKITDTLPQSLTFRFFAGGVTGVQSGSTLTWTIGTLNSGASSAVIFVATVSGVGTITNTAQVSGTTTDPDPTNNTATSSLIVLPTADLTLGAIAVPEFVTVGERLTYSLAVTNFGPSAAGGVILTDTLPEGVIVDSASVSQGSFVVENGVVTFDLGDVPSDTIVTAEIVVIPTVGGTVLTNSAEVTSTSSVDPNPFDNEMIVETFVSPTQQSNRPPVLAAIGNLTLDEGTTRAVTVSATDADGDALTLSASGLPPFASFADNGDGTGVLTITPGFAAAGTYAAVSVSVSDGSASDAELFTIVVNNVNRPPVATDDAYDTREDVALSALAAQELLVNDTDADGDTLAAILMTNVAHGALSLSANGSFAYTPAAGYNGTDSFTYRVNDGHALNNLSNVATVTLTISSVNDAPTGTAKTVTTLEDTAYVFSVADFGFSDPADSPADTLLAVNITTLPTAGALTNNGAPVTAGQFVSVIDLNAGRLLFAPAANGNGGAYATFTFQVRDNGGTDNGGVDLDETARLLTIDVTADNDTPVAADDHYTTNEDTAIIIATAEGALANDTDVEHSALTAILVTGPSRGTLTLNANGSFTFTPTTNYNGADSFTYKANDGLADSNVAIVSLTINAVNDAPVAVNDSYSTNEDTELVVAAPGILGNDTDIDSAALITVHVSGPQHGQLALNNLDGSFIYAPFPNFNGLDSFTYKVNDGVDDSNIAVVSITVNAVNDRPVARNDNYSTDEDTALNVGAPGVLANDTDIENNSLSAILLSGVIHGQLTLNLNGSFTYTPASNFNGTDTFTYKANDGAVDSNVAVVTLTVNAVNDVPVANNDTAITDEDTPVVINVRANDTDVDGDTLTAIVVTQPANGTAVTNPDGTITYTPSLNFSGQGGFTYRVSDGHALSNLATVTIEVIPSNHAPVAIDDAVTTNEDTPKIINVLANDQDADGDALIVNSFTQATNGHVVGNANGTLTYTPNANFNGVDSFTYTVGDGNGESSTATVTVKVLPVNDAPVLDAMSATEVINEGGVVRLQGAFSDADLSDVFSLTVNWGDGSVEVLSISDAKSFTLTHKYLDDNPTGTPSDNYLVKVKLADNNGGSAEASRTVLVNNVAPVANLTGSSSGVRGQQLSFAGSISDVGILDTHQASWNFGDGTVIGLHSSTDAEALTPTHVYTTTGTYTVKLTVRDDDGGTVTVSKQVTIKAVDIQTDPCDPTKTALVVGGTNGNDTIRFVPQGNKGEIKVLINGVSQGIFKPTGRIIAYGLGGDDDIEVAVSISLTAMLQGDSGNDRLKGGAGASVLCGGDGDDLLIGGNGRSILIGDRGADRLVGNSEDDILIGGHTSYGCDHEAWCEILETWTRRDLSYAQRINKLSAGPFALNRTTVFDDGDYDQLTGAAGDDWFFAGLKDKITDRKNFEIVLSI